jgi:hypothetical protein
MMNLTKGNRVFVSKNIDIKTPFTGTIIDLIDRGNRGYFLTIRLDKPITILGFFSKYTQETICLDVAGTVTHKWHSNVKRLS